MSASCVVKGHAMLEIWGCSAGAGDASAAKMSTAVAQVFGIPFRQRMQSLQGAKPAVERESLAFQARPHPGIPPAAIARS